MQQNFTQLLPFSLPVRHSFKLCVDGSACSPIHLLRDIWIVPATLLLENYCEHVCVCFCVIFVMLALSALLA